MGNCEFLSLVMRKTNDCVVSTTPDRRWITRKHHDKYSNDEKLIFSSQWHTDMDNVSRTNAIIKRIASQVRDMTGVAPVIAPLNE